MITMKERELILDYEVKRLMLEGWWVDDRTATTCNLIKESEISGCASLFLLFPFFIKDETLFLNIKVTSEGVIEHS